LIGTQGLQGLIGTQGLQGLQGQTGVFSGTTTSTVNINNATISTSTNSGALTVTGGVGIGGVLNVASTSYIAGAQVLTTATVAPYAGGVSINVESFTGNGSTTTFVLSTVPASINYIQINIDGVGQIQSSYSLSSSTVVFSNAPANGSKIQVTEFASLGGGGGSGGSSIANFTNATASTSTTTGAVTVVGGVGIGGAITVGNTSTFYGDILPGTNNIYNLGSSSTQWKSLYVSTSTIYIGGTAISVSGGSLQVGGSPVTGSASTATASAGGAIWVNSATISSNYTINSGYNGFTVGPVTVTSGTSVTVAAGQRWVVI
jgi:hypothetical protein